LLFTDASELARARIREQQAGPRSGAGLIEALLSGKARFGQSRFLTGSA